jgi:hypothetical protein
MPSPPVSSITDHLTTVLSTSIFPTAMPQGSITSAIFNSPHSPQAPEPVPRSMCLIPLVLLLIPLAYLFLRLRAYRSLPRPLPHSTLEAAGNPPASSASTSSAQSQASFFRRTRPPKLTAIALTDLEAHPCCPLPGGQDHCFNTWDLSPTASEPSEAVAETDGTDGLGDFDIRDIGARTDRRSGAIPEEAAGGYGSSSGADCEHAPRLQTRPYAATYLRHHGTLPPTQDPSSPLAIYFNPDGVGIARYESTAWDRESESGSESTREAGERGITDWVVRRMVRGLGWLVGGLGRP